MFKYNIVSGRFTLLLAFIKWFLLVSFLLRLVFIILTANSISWNFTDFYGALFTGLFFDIGTISWIVLPALIYYFILPNRFVGLRFDKIIVYFITAITLFLLIFVFFAEITFWEEFKTRFNFIAVDYLIYTHEVIANIQESYPLPVLVLGVILITAIVFFIFHKKNVFKKTFTQKASLKQKTIILFLGLSVVTFYSIFITNNQAEWSKNRYNAEISKSGIYSFFAAFRNNQMEYTKFYTKISNEKAFGMIRKKLAQENVEFKDDGLSIHRTITDTAASNVKQNVVFILVESLSASFMNEFGSNENNMPFLDSLAQKSIFFKNLYATGTRTVRGMEAVTLCIPPTPGQSIVKRPDNQNLFTVANVFKSKQYNCNFFYGGDGYFDNMNAYFGGNGFTIYDRGRGSVLSDKIKTIRNNITDNEVTFENAWGICDEDIYNKMLKVADEKFAKKQPFFNFVMTTSNHRPYTYPNGKIDIPSGTSRQGALKYTDFALRQMFKKAKTKDWYKNTVFVIIADHCASSAGKDEIDVANYHIPAFIVNLPENQNQKIIKQCSQIDLFPTLFALFHWNYESDFFGKDVQNPNFQERALLGTYRKLVLMKGTKTMILSDQKQQKFYNWNKTDNSLQPLPMDQSFLNETISWYQTADYLFSYKLLK